MMKARKKSPREIKKLQQKSIYIIYSRFEISSCTRQAVFNFDFFFLLGFLVWYLVKY